MASATMRTSAFVAVALLLLCASGGCEARILMGSQCPWSYNSCEQYTCGEAPSSCTPSYFEGQCNNDDFVPWFSEACNNNWNNEKWSWSNMEPIFSKIPSPTCCDIINSCNPDARKHICNYMPAQWFANNCQHWSHQQCGEYLLLLDLDLQLEICQLLDVNLCAQILGGLSPEDCKPILSGLKGCNSEFYGKLISVNVSLGGILGGIVGGILG